MLPANRAPRGRPGPGDSWPDACHTGHLDEAIRVTGGNSSNSKGRETLYEAYVIDVIGDQSYPRYLALLGQAGVCVLTFGVYGLATKFGGL